MLELRPNPLGAAPGAETAVPVHRNQPTLVISEPESADPLLGAMVGSFQILRLLGRGGMGSVYLAEHPLIGNRVAVKFLHEALGSSRELIQRFLLEARAVNLVAHENLVRVHDLNVLPPNRHYMVMEHLEGRPLSDLVRQGIADLGLALRILLQVCSGLGAAHRHGVIHRDLKPDNIFLLERPQGGVFVKVLDFGIAKLRDASRTDSPATVAGALLGTPEYMAPEQCEGRPADARADVYALGVIAYQLVTGRLPFVESSILGLLMAQVREVPPPPRSLRGEVPVALEKAILRALAKHPEDRFQSMAEFASELSVAMVEGAGAHLPAAGLPRLKGLRVEVRRSEYAAQWMEVLDLSRGGAFLIGAGATELPLLARLSLSFPRVGQPPLEVSAEVVRPYCAEEARSWGRPDGCVVQFLSPGPTARAALDALAAQQAARAVAPTPFADPVVAAFLERQVGGSGSTIYARLEIPPDVRGGAIRARAGALRAEVEVLRDRPASPEQAAQLSAVVTRLEVDLATLEVVERRAAYDASIGNYVGVRRCCEAGLAPSRLEQLHVDFLKLRPGLEEQIERRSGRARLAQRVGNLEAARTEACAALTQDPLHPALQALLAMMESRATP